MQLLDTELILLDGQCRPEIQAQVDAAKARIIAVAALPDLPVNLAGFVADVVREAVTNGKLVFYHMRLSYCSLCKKSAGYVQRTRSSRAGRRGEPNYDRPLTFGGYELAQRFVTMRNRAALGCCETCWARVKAYLADALKNTRAAIPEGVTGYAPKFAWYQNARCTKCGWTGHEGEMRKARTLMDDGYYPAGCPKCQAESSLFSREVEVADGFTVVPAETVFTPPARNELPKVTALPAEEEVPF